MRSGKKKENINEEEKDTTTSSGISLMKHNRLRVLSESSSSKIISTKTDLILPSNMENFFYKKNITVAEKIKQLKNKKYYLRKNHNNRFKTSNSSIDTSSSSSNINNDIFSDKDSISSHSHPPLISAFSYSGDWNRRSKESPTHPGNPMDPNITDPSTLAQPIRQELQIKAKESISDIILACRSLIQTSNVSNDLSKAAYNFSLLDSVFTDIDSTITKVNQNLTLCKQKNNEITTSLNELNETQEDVRRVKDLVVAYITG